MSTHDADKNCISKKYIHSGGWVILIKSGKAPIYYSLHETMNQYFGNLSYVIITFKQTSESSFTNYLLGIKMLLPKYCDISDDHQIGVADPTYNLRKVPVSLVIMYHTEANFKATTQLADKYRYLEL